MEGKESFVKFDKGAIYQTAPANVETQPKEQVKEDVKAELKANKTTKKAPEKKEEKVEDVQAPVVEEKTDAE